MSNLYMPDATLPQLFEFVRCEADPVRRGHGAELWLRLPQDHNFPLYTTVRATPRLAEFIAGNSIYGSERDLDRSHFFEIIFRDDDTALVVMQYQQILGSRWLCVVPKSHVLDWVSDNIEEGTPAPHAQKRMAI